MPHGNPDLGFMQISLDIRWESSSTHLARPSRPEDGLRNVSALTVPRQPEDGLHNVSAWTILEGGTGFIFKPVFFTGLRVEKPV